MIPLKTRSASPVREFRPPSRTSLAIAARVGNGLDPVQFDPETLGIARERAESQLGTQPLSHYDPNGKLIFAYMLGNASVPYAIAGENLARSTVDDANLPQRVE